jgi:hypothetical protein
MIYVAGGVIPGFAATLSVKKLALGLIVGGVFSSIMFLFSQWYLGHLRED